MTVTTRAIEYEHLGKTFEGVLAWDDVQTGALPAVLIAHAWAGRTENEVEFAKRIAGLGYAGFALDLYGKGIVGASKEENQKLMSPFLEDRGMLQSRLQRIVDVVKDQPEVDSKKIAIMGFCFGGLCALDLARTGAEIRGAASFHGLFNPPGDTQGKKIKAKVIAFHGWDDPMVPPEDVVALGKELTEAGADWQIHAYGGTMHAFTNPEANDPDFGTVYNKTAADRAWTSFQTFLKECFG
ncbi:dienelactone hydrolase family protein [Amphiplicatus metriothermophilus]|uniref:Dienelactone hydrolase n=1 Tax=Amphiplicatus metriothermophilus TaxID=1519374 RepID=A0A239PSX2_9PROT|nr:dienelactone hydrolase family protein [Amphiplicatus metriothermophilus]MBB5519296.1 dienelactone hydrolase [Amphiplicatus metriothermophilus]SNT73365.1 Dienelactone hydrolase [Amphiplicatus metriothermophilus]